MTAGSARAPAGNPLQARPRRRRRRRRRWWSYVPVRVSRCASGRYACIHVHAIPTLRVSGRVARWLGYIRIRWTYRNRASAILLCLFNMCNRQRAQIQSIKSINDSIVRSHRDTCASSWVIADHAIVLSVRRTDHPFAVCGDGWGIIPWDFLSNILEEWLIRQMIKVTFAINNWHINWVLAGIQIMTSKWRQNDSKMITKNHFLIICDSCNVILILFMICCFCLGRSNFILYKRRVIKYYNEWW